MKIVGSKVSDYYDCCIGLFGYSNEGNIFLREPESLTVNSEIPTSRYYRERKPNPNDHLNFLVNGFPFNYREYRDAENRAWSVRAFRILFAGKLYGGVSVKTTHTSVWNPAGMENEHFFYSWEPFSEHLNLYKINIDKSEKRITDEDRIKKHFNVIDVIDQCIANKLVVAHIVLEAHNIGYTVTMNGELKRFHFFKALNPFTAYQELAMYVDGQLTYPGNQIIEIEDKYRIAAHGFDKKSFRKDPTKHFKK